jgi:hypothetical protein
MVALVVLPVLHLRRCQTAADILERLGSQRRRSPPPRRLVWDRWPASAAGAGALSELPEAFRRPLYEFR